MSNNQSKLIMAAIAVVLATTLLTAVVFDQADAKRNRQSISQHNHASQTSSITSSGGSVSNSGNQGVTQSNTNNGGNAAAF